MIKKSKPYLSALFVNPQHALQFIDWVKRIGAWRNLKMRCMANVLDDKARMILGHKTKTPVIG